ncbi:MAG: phage holin family protein [Betaproteobacteria bacterium]
MPTGLSAFLIHWAVMAFVLWVASHVFKGITYTKTSALWIAALLLGLANAILRPVLVVLTLPLTFITFGFFLLVINALMVMLVSAVVKDFHVRGFWTAFFAAIFISVLSLILYTVISPSPEMVITMPGGGTKI